MPKYWKNVSQLTLDQVEAELRQIAELEQKKTLRGDLPKRKKTLEKKLKLAGKTAAH